MPKIFVVEDDAIISHDIQRTVRRLGYEVAGTAQSGVEAVLALEQSVPDLVLMDIKLGGRVDGIQATATIRKRWQVPVIYLTAHSDDATLLRAKETAPHGYLLKPFHERDLRIAIEVALKKHELEVKLAERERWFSTTLESIGDAVIATDRSERITFMNAVAEQITGWSRGDARGKQVHEVFRVVDANGDSVNGVVGEAMRGAFKVELPAGSRLVDRLGATKDVGDSVAPILDPQGTMLGSVVVFRDITERQKLEERLTASERLASISAVAAGMAHEINTPLAATVANVEFAMRRLDEIKQDVRNAGIPAGIQHAVLDALDALTDANVTGGRLRSIVNDLKKLTHPDDAAQGAVDLPDAIDAAIELTRLELGAKTRVVRNLGTTPLVGMVEGRLTQVLSNLLINAAHASATRIEITTRADDSGKAWVTVRDNGKGIAPDVLPRVFDPFFTTKPVGKGLGLGLAICHSIVKAAGGELSVETDLGNGTTFSIQLPAAIHPTDRRSPSTPPPPVRRGRVLLVDDDEMVGKVVQRILLDIHDIETETDARAALRRIRAGEHFDALLCDLTMPNVDGIEFFEELSKLDAALAARVIFLTGGVTSERANAFLENCGNVVVHKPFTMNRLRAVVSSFVK